MSTWPEWQPIETAPMNVPVLVFGKWTGEISDWDEWHAIGVAQRTSVHGRWYSEHSDYYSVTCEPTHWMHLPPPPGGADAT